ncbi:General secretion pathway protein D [Candidatus Methylobacter favarea]|uniref:General secretion pathway protein D n=1 Tax=Candidatus Methylobacter favarea TaxID=2707345 RepID=A0A8S0XHX5_9GAMM|nr:type II secretion system secretin GspD [Candidatus Methylobacter favarea]CAA9892163.1 General secretion pathway protein D [Candidatus Methylobacter favarea]
MNTPGNKKALLCFLIASLMLSSCELLNPRQAAKLPLVPAKKDQESDKTGAVFKELRNKPPSSETIRPKNEIILDTDRFTAGSIAQHRRTGTRGEASYSLNFDEADLGEVAKVILSDILGQNYVLSPKVGGKVTLQTTQALTKEELLPTLEMVLKMNNAALVKDGRIYHIEPAEDALYNTSFSTSAGTGKPGYQIKVIPVRNVAVENLVEVLKPLVPAKSILHVDGTRNILLASGTADELARIMDMVSTFDIDMLKGRSFGLFPLTHVEPEKIIEELEAVFNKKGDEESDFFRFIAIDRLNAVMAITHQARYLKDIENWVLRLDRANSGTGGGVNVYKAQHADAEELAGTLNEIFTGAQKKDSSAKVASGKKSAELSNKDPAKQSVAKSSSSANKQTGNAEVANVGEVRIIADKANNSVVVVATAQEYEVIRKVIAQLDVVPLQVLIDATIASVELKDNLKYGIAWFLNNGNSNIGSALGPGTSLGSTAAAATSAFATGGLSLVYNSGAVNAILSAQADKGNLNVISSPSLMVLNNQQAKINVGDQVPIQTSTTQLPIAGGQTPSIAQSASIQYLDTGVTLEVTPRVNANGVVIMEIKQVFSTPFLGNTGVSTSPTIAKKEIESFIAVNDGETIVLGGLIDDTNNAVKSGIPFLHELPWIGPLFGNTTFTRTKRELVILITPRVVKSKQDSRLISDEFKRKLTGIYQEYPVSSIKRRGNTGL